MIWKFSNAKLCWSHNVNHHIRPDSIIAKTCLSITDWMMAVHNHGFCNLCTLNARHLHCYTKDLYCMDSAWQTRFIKYVCSIMLKRQFEDAQYDEFSTIASQIVHLHYIWAIATTEMYYNTCYDMHCGNFQYKNCSR